jgi:hypothetical protein
MQDVKWESGQQYIRVAMDVHGDGHFQPCGTTQLLSVPYALYANRAGESLGGSSRAGNQHYL